MRAPPANADIHYRTRAGIMKTAFNVDLEADVKRHLESCSQCQKIAPLLQLKAQSLKLGDFPERVVDAGLAGEASVLARKEGHLNYFFGRPPGDTRGGYIIVWHIQRRAILHIEYADIKRFRQFSFNKRH
jgi:hypothetical protein